MYKQKKRKRERERKKKTKTVVQTIRGDWEDYLDREHLLKSYITPRKYISYKHFTEEVNDEHGNYISLDRKYLEHVRVISFRVSVGIGRRFNIYFGKTKRTIINRGYRNFTLVHLKIYQRSGSYFVNDVNAQAFPAVRIPKNLEIFVEGKNGELAELQVVSQHPFEKKICIDEQLYDLNYKYSADEIYDHFFKFEKDVDFGKRFESLALYWTIMRNRVSNHLLHKTRNIPNRWIITTGKVFWAKAKTINDSELDALTRKSDPRKAKKSDILLFQHNAYIEHNGRIVNSRTRDFPKMFKDIGKTFVKVNDSSQGIQIEPASARVKFIEHLDIYRFENENRPVVFSEEEYQKINDFEKAFAQYFGLIVPLHHLFTEAKRYFEIDYEWFRDVMIQVQPKAVFMLAAYGKLPLIAAANDLGIKTFEYQYSAVTPNHIAYNRTYPLNPRYSHTMCLMWGDFFTTQYNVDHVKAATIGYDADANGLLLEVEDSKDGILIVAQGEFGEENIKLIKNLVPNTRRDVYFKLHRHEFSIAHEKYAELYELMDTHSNFKVVDTPSLQLGDFSEKVSFVIGCFSSALFEFAQLQKIILVQNFSGAHHMEKLIESYQNVLLLQEDIELSDDYFDRLEKIMSYIYQSRDMGIIERLSKEKLRISMEEGGIL